MAITTLGSGTQSATISTEHTLQDTSAAGTYVLTVDTNAMVSGDTLELRAYKMTLTSGTRRQCFFYKCLNAQDDSTDAKSKIKVSVPISTALTDSGAVRFTLKQTAGTGRSFPWCVEKYA